MDLIAALGTAYEIHRAGMADLETRLRRDSFLVEAEIPLPRNADWPHARIDIADFIIVRQIETGHERVEMPATETAPTGLTPATYRRGDMTVVIDDLVWDRVLFEMEGRMIEAEALDDVLARWHWRASTETLPDAPGLIHSLSMTPAGLGVDFGSAPPAAFLDLIDTLDALDIPAVRITRAD